MEYQTKIVSLETAQSKVQQWKSHGYTVVFTNGCFDIMHRGHAEYLQAARNCGDCLVVGLNSDASIQRLKGPQRPINEEADRAAMLASLACIDLVVVFSEDTPLQLISRLLPDLLVKGGDWPLDQIVGKDVVEQHGGHVQTIPLVAGKSTTAIIEKIVTIHSKKEK